MRNWLFGWYITEFEKKGADRAKYGSKLIAELASSLKVRGLKGLSSANLKQCRSFYLCYKAIGQSLPDQLPNPELIHQSLPDVSSILQTNHHVKTEDETQKIPQTLSAESSSQVDFAERE
ncbi:MAG: hypothetical protein HQ517_15990 [SAR324 cluster bacterium]|nr:hypothetical protein [SAR324 cluster bacterium]